MHSIWVYAANSADVDSPVDPPLTKDAIAGRIRRLLAMVDRRAADLGLPSTEASLTADMLPLFPGISRPRVVGLADSG